MSNASGDDEELKEALRELRTAAFQHGQGLSHAVTQLVDAKQSALESLFGRIKEERDRARTELAEAERVMREIMDNSESVLRQIANAKGEES